MVKAVRRIQGLNHWARILHLVTIGLLYIADSFSFKFITYILVSLTTITLNHIQG